MTKRVHAKHKIDRRLGENIWGRPKSPYNKREYGPGEHGQRRRGKLSDYGQQLRAKQKLKGYYGNITEKQFKAIYSEAARLRGDTSENLIGLLERLGGSYALFLGSQPLSKPFNLDSILSCQIRHLLSIVLSSEDRAMLKNVNCIDSHTLARDMPRVEE